MKPWPHYHRMQAFMPSTQPWGTHTFDPASSSAQLATQILNAVNTEEAGAEDQVDPLPDSNSPLIPPDLAFSTYSILSSFLPPDSSISSSSSHTKPPSSSSLHPTVYPQHTKQQDISMGSTYSITSQLQKCKYDARLASSMQPHSFKQSLTSKTNYLNPVIITTALDSTLNHMVDVMGRTLNATAAPSAPITSLASPPIVNSSIESFQTLSASTLSPAEIFNQAVRIISSVNSQLTEDQLLSASLFFTSALDDAVYATCTFITLGNNQTVQYHFLLSQLSTLSAKGKSRAMDNEDDFMVT